MSDYTELAESRADAIAEEFKQFAYIVSHDMGAPVRHVREFLSLLVEELSDHIGETEAKYVHFIQRATDRLQSMIEGMLAFSRLNTQRREVREVDLDARVRQLVKFEFAHAPQIEIGPLPTIRCDYAQIQALIENLFDNSLKFQRDPAAARIELRCEDIGTHHEFRVIDNGIGIESRHFERMFEIMARLHAPTDYPGLGFGLALARKIVTRHRGEIDVESKLGRGTTIRFTLAKAPD